VVLVMIDGRRIPLSWNTNGNLDLIMADFTYVRWLRALKGIEEKTMAWDRTIVYHTGELKEWLDVLMKCFSSEYQKFCAYE
jgi:hypothetical protein